MAIEVPPTLSSSPPMHDDHDPTTTTTTTPTTCLSQTSPRSSHPHNTGQTNNNCFTHSQQKTIINRFFNPTGSRPMQQQPPPPPQQKVNFQTLYQSNKHLHSILGLFIFYVGHDALQERMFRFDGFEFGFFMTLVEVLVMLVGSSLGPIVFRMLTTTTNNINNNKSSNTLVVSSSGEKKNYFGKKFSDSMIDKDEDHEKGDINDDDNKSEEKGRRKNNRCTTKNNILGSSLSIPTLIRIGWVGLFLALAHGLGNTALRYSPYPLKVAFKSCKLVPTMALGACVTGRKHTALQYTAALVMGLGLAVLTAADVFTGATRLRNLSTLVVDEQQQQQQRQLHNPQLQPYNQNQHPNQHPPQGIEFHDDIDNLLGGTIAGPLLGPTLLLVSTFFDSIIPNLQEQLLQTAKVQTSEMIFVSNTVMCIVLVAYTAYSGEFLSAWRYCLNHTDASWILFLQGLCAYWGLQSYLAIIRDHGGVVGVLLANARKIVTIVLSFLLFSKPFNARHFVGLVLVFVGVYLGYLSKKGGGKNIGSSSSGSKEGGGSPHGKKGRKKVNKNDSGDHHHHEHSV